MKPMSTRETGEPLRLAAFLPYRLNVAATVVSNGLAALYGERFGIGIPEWRVLATVGEYGRITAKDVGQHSEMGKVKVSRAAGVLERRGLIRREPNADDMRESHLTLTPEGRLAYEEIVPVARQYAAGILAGMDQGEIDVFNKVLDEIVGKARG